MEPYRILMVIDMQNDFANSNPKGSFYVENETNSVRANLVRLIKSDGYWDEIIATKDFHPHDHVSFKNKFPPHCVQKHFHQFETGISSYTAASNEEATPDETGQKYGKARGGAKFHPDVLDALGNAKCKNKSVFFKAFFKQFDSFGGVSYTPEYARDRGLSTEEILGTKDNPGAGTCHNQQCMNAFTGSYKFPLQNESDIDSDPAEGYNDATETTDSNEAVNNYSKYTRLDDHIDAIIQEKKWSGRKVEIRICGLALDFCVKDTAVNLNTKYKVYENVDIKIVLNASGPADPGYINNEKNEEVKKLWVESMTIKTTGDVVKGFNAHVDRINPNRSTGGGVHPLVQFANQLGGSKSLRTNLLWNAGFLLLATFIASVVPR